MTTQTSVHSSHQRVRRAATISAGTLLLCLAGAAPALASTIPLPVPSDLTSVTSVTSVPQPPQPVGDLVHQLSDAAGISDPLTTDPTQPVLQQHPKTNSGGPTRQHRHSNTPSLTSTTQRTTTVPATMGPFVPTAIPGLRGVPLTTSSVIGTIAAPTVARPQSTVAQLASHARSLIAGLPDGGIPASRMVAMILGTMIIGLLAAGHIRVAQDNLDAMVVTPR